MIIELNNSALMGGMLSAMLCPKEMRSDESKRLEDSMKKAEAEVMSRRGKSILLRAKLYQAIARDSEHTIEVEGQR